MTLKRAAEEAPFKYLGLTVGRFGEAAAYVVFCAVWGQGKLNGPLYYIGAGAFILQGIGMILRIVGWADKEPAVLVAPQIERKKNG